MRFDISETKMMKSFEKNLSFFLVGFVSVAVSALVSLVFDYTNNPPAPVVYSLDPALVLTEFARFQADLDQITDAEFQARVREFSQNVEAEADGLGQDGVLIINSASVLGGATDISDVIAARAFAAMGN